MIQTVSAQMDSKTAPAKTNKPTGARKITEDIEQIQSQRLEQLKKEVSKRLEKMGVNQSVENAGVHIAIVF